MFMSSLQDFESLKPKKRRYPKSGRNLKFQFFGGSKLEITLNRLLTQGNKL